MSAIGRLTTWVNQTAQAAHYYSIAKHGFSINGTRPLNRKQTTCYFIAGLGLGVIDVFKSKKNSSNINNPLFAASALIIPTNYKVEKNTDLKPALTSLSIANINSGNSAARINEDVKAVVYAAMLGLEYWVVSIEEIASYTNLGVQIIKDTLKVMMDESYDGKEKISMIEGYYCFDKLMIEEKRNALQAAKDRYQERLNKFVLKIDDLIAKIEALPSTSTRMDIMHLIEKERAVLGIRNLDVLSFDPVQGLFLDQQESFPNIFYRPAQPPEALMRSVLDNPNYSFAFDIGADTKETKKIFRQMKLEWDKDTSRKLFDALRENGIENLIILKSLSEDGKPQSILVISNPLFFGKKENERVMRALNRLAKAVGRTLGRINATNKVSQITRPIDLNSLPISLKSYDLEKEKAFWDWVFSSGKGRHVGLEAKIGGPVTNAHRRDFIMSMKGRVSEHANNGKTVILEDAAGERPLTIRLIEALMTEIGDSRFLPEVVRKNLQIQARDLSEAAVNRAMQYINENKLGGIISVGQGNMFEKNEAADGLVDFTLGCMPFYCDRDHFRKALSEWARKAKTESVGWFSIKAKDGDLGVVVKDTIRGVWRAYPLWQRLIFPFGLVRMLGFIIQRKRSGAFEYSKKLRQGFEEGRYYAPNEEQLREDLAAAGLSSVGITRSLANQFFLVEWKKLSA